jgi:hypothetical protein
MKGIDRRLHPRILRFSSRFIAGIDANRRNHRRVFFDGFILSELPSARHSKSG